MLQWCQSTSFLFDLNKPDFPAGQDHDTIANPSAAGADKLHRHPAQRLNPTLQMLFNNSFHGRSVAHFGAVC
jgi:hypothetical protein